MGWFLLWLSLGEKRGGCTSRCALVGSDPSLLQGFNAKLDIVLLHQFENISHSPLIQYSGADNTKPAF